TTKRSAADSLLNDNQLNGNDTSKSQSTNPTEEENKKQLYYYVQWNITQQGQAIDDGVIGHVRVKDSAIVRTYLESPAVRSQFPAEMYFLYGMPEREEVKK